MESWSFWIEDALLTQISLSVVSCPSYSALRLAKTVKKSGRLLTNGEAERHGLVGFDTKD